MLAVLPNGSGVVSVSFGQLRLLSATFALRKLKTYAVVDPEAAILD
jgi:hypothetical protein